MYRGLEQDLPICAGGLQLIYRHLLTMYCALWSVCGGGVRHHVYSVHVYNNMGGYV